MKKLSDAKKAELFDQIVLDIAYAYRICTCAYGCHYNSCFGRIESLLDANLGKNWMGWRDEE